MTFDPSLPTGNRSRHRAGHWLIRCPDHPRAMGNGYVIEHRLVMERLLGRYLEPGETVKHHNGDLSDNRPENLRLVPAPTLAGRFWSRVAQGNGCWAWQGRRHRQGYGIIWVGRDPKLAHRVSYEMNVGPIPHGLKVCHRCDYPPCVNPAHLFLGSQRDNMRDCALKRRNCRLAGAALVEARQLVAGGVPVAEVAARFGVSRSTVLQETRVGGPRGERNRNAKLNAAQVCEIRRRRAVGERVAELAREYEVTKSAIEAIIRGKTWKHVEPLMADGVHVNVTAEDIQAAMSDEVTPLFGGGP